MTTTTTAVDLVLAYGPRDKDQPCRTCGTTIPADPRPDFGYETEDDQAQPVCDTCLRRLDPAGHSAVSVLRVIAEAADNAADPDTASAFLWTITAGIDLLNDAEPETRA